MQTDLFKDPAALPSVIIGPEDDGDVVLYPSLIGAEDADRYFTQLHRDIAWEKREIKVFGKRHWQPRLVAWYGDEGVSYRYSGDTLYATPWIPPLQVLRQRCEAAAGTSFNSVLLNLYRDGQDAMGWHADNESELGNAPIIASVSLGCARRFDFRKRSTGEARKVILPHGSLIIMSGRTQQNWVHQIPRSKKISDPRINLTFRRIYSDV